jgi:hypothetical protein
MSTFPIRNDRLSGRVSLYLHSLTFCSILLMLVLIPSVVLPESAKCDSSQDYNIKRTLGVGIVSDDSGILLERDNARPVSLGVAAAESTTTFSWNGLLNSSTGINHTSEQPRASSAYGGVHQGSASQLVKHTLGGKPPATSVIAQSSCGIRLSQPSGSFGPGAGHGQFTLTVNSFSPTLCGWTATFVSNSCSGDDCWVRPPMRNGSPGVFRFEYDVSENSGAQRKGEFEIVAGDSVETYTITQDGVVQPPLPCSYTVSNLTVPVVPAEGGEGTFSVGRSRTNCAWSISVTTDPPGGGWISVVPTRPGTNETDTSVTYAVAPQPNSGSALRQASIRIIGDNSLDVTRTVTQQPRIELPPGCAGYSVSPANVAIPAQGIGITTFTVTTNQECPPWAPLSDVPWIHVTAPIGNSTGNGVVSYSVDGNTGSSERTVHIMVQNAAHTVVQAGAAQSSTCTFELSPMSAEVRSEGDSLIFAVTTTPATGCTWSAVSSVPWIKTNSIGNGIGMVKYTVDPNLTASSRPGTITVGNTIFKVTQAGVCAVTIVPQKAFVGEISASYGFEVNAECSWTATTEFADWIILNKKSSSANGKGTVLFNVTENLKGAGERRGTIRVGDKIYEIVQAAPGGSCPKNSIANPPLTSISNVGQIVYGSLSTDDCTPSKLFLRADRYIFKVDNPGSRIAINLASSSASLDPKISLMELTPQGDEIPVTNGTDDDGAAFRNVRIPPLSANDQFVFRHGGMYIVEVTSFHISQVGNYGLLINPDPADAQSQDCVSLGCSDPKILGAVTDAKTLIVTGENFKEGAELLIDNGDGLMKQKTQNEKSRSRTTLIALKSAKTAKQADRGCAVLQVRNTLDGKTSNVFVFGICNPDK